MSERDLFIAALQIEDPEGQSAYLDGACGPDDGLRRRVEALLRAFGQAGSFLQQPAAAATSEVPPAVPARNGAPAEGPGTLIGPYKVLEQIGEGGMGTVYVAEQTQPIHRKVAIKVIKAGMDSRQVIARFEAERQALALMDHVNIARVLDAGATASGLPYFVMELVHGVPITKYCDDNHLTPQQRLELFVPVCQAIQHAHQKGVIHRDVKPSNVLVTLYDGRPVPKVIDFGIAKATEQKLTERTLFTQYGAMVGTLEYMSPEQAEMSALGVDTRSDVYSLGVLLYELLTGSTPLTHKRVKEAAYAEILRMIKEEEPPRPSARLSDSDEALASISAQRHMEPARLTRLVRGELDWIVMKTLEKDRNRRYETANGLAMDVQRYLADEPVHACPPSAQYRFRKFAMRNKRALASVAVMGLAVLVAIVALAISNVLIARESAEKAQALEDKDAALQAAESKEALAKQAQKEAVANLQDALKAVDQMLTRVAEERFAHLPQIEQMQRVLLEDALKFYQAFLKEKSRDPIIRRELGKAYGKVANYYRYLGQAAQAEDAFGKSIALLEQLAAEFPEEADTRAALVLHHTQYSWLLLPAGRPKDVEKAQRRAVALAEELVARYPGVPGHQERLARAYAGLSGHLSDRDEREKHLRQAIALAEKCGSQLEQGKILVELGNCLEGGDRVVEAEAAYRRGLALVASSPFHEDRARALNHLGWVHHRTGRPRQAEEFYAHAITTYGKIVADSPTVPSFRENLANCHYNMGNLMQSAGRLAEAEESYRRALGLYEKLAVDFAKVPAYRQAAFNHRLNLGQLLTAAGRPQDAQEVYRLAIDLPDKLGADAPTQLKHWESLVRTHMELGRQHAAAGKKPEAEAAYGQVVAIQEVIEAAVGGKPQFRRELIQSHLEATALLKAAGHTQGVEKLYRRAAEQSERLLADSPDLAESSELLGNVTTAYHEFLKASGKIPEMERFWRDRVDRYAKLAAEFPKAPEFRFELARSHCLLGYPLTQLRRYPEAEKCNRWAVPLLENLVVECPGHPKYRTWLSNNYYHLANHQIIAKRHQEADEFYVKSIEANPRNLQAWSARVRNHMEVSRLLAAAGKMAEADAVYGQVVAVQEKLEASVGAKPESQREVIQSHLEAAHLLKAASQTEGAAKLYRRAVQQSERLLVAAPTAAESVTLDENAISQYDQFLWSGRQPEREDYWRRRAARFAKLAKDFPQVPQYLYQVAHSHSLRAYALRSLGRLPEEEESNRRAIAILEELVVKFPAEPRYCRWLAENYRNLANHLVRKREWETAADYSSKAIDLKPDHWNAWFRRGEAYYQLGQPEKARRDFDKVDELKPNDPWLWNNHAWFLCDKGRPLRDGELAAELAKRADALRPDNSAILNTLGAACYRAHEWKAAIETLRDANEKGSGELVSLNGFFLAMAHWQLGEKEQARRWYSAAVFWREKHAPTDGNLNHFGAEAAALLGLPDRPLPPAGRPRPGGDDLEIYRLVLEADPRAVWAYRNRGDALVRAGRQDEAAADYAKVEPSLRQALEKARSPQEEASPRVAGALAQLGQNLLRQKKHAEAEPLLRECLEIRAAKEPDAWTTFNARSMLGGALTGRKKYADAEPLLVQGYEGMKQREATIPAAGKIRLTEALERLVQLSDARGKPAEAARWRAELTARKAPPKEEKTPPPKK